MGYWIFTIVLCYAITLYLLLVYPKLEQTKYLDAWNMREKTMTLAGTWEYNTS